MRFVVKVVIFILMIYTAFCCAKCPIRSDDIHCIYTSGLDYSTQGKYVKLKSIGEDSYPVTSIRCVGNNAHHYIMQVEGPYFKPNQEIIWQFSQCIDEDCYFSHSILMDKFVVKKNDKDLYISEPGQAEVHLDPNYGVNCEISNGKIHF